jgi:hypothetical protein
LIVCNNMPSQRKPPVKPSGLADNARPPDTVDYTPESTTVRLKSIRLRRREKEMLEHQQDIERRVAEYKKRPEPQCPPDDRPAGRVRHDERGMAVWDWAVASGEFHTLSATSALKKLGVEDLKIEETSRVAGLSIEKSSRDKGGGFDPYNQRDSVKKPGKK